MIVCKEDINQIRNYLHFPNDGHFVALSSPCWQEGSNIPFQRAVGWPGEANMVSTVSVHPILAEAVGTVSPFPLNATEKQPLLFGCTEKMTVVRRIIDQVADTDITVLIRGESGTGKELVAREICMRSARRDKPFVKVNCAAIPSELLESELFGFEKGSFTGAISRKPGKFEFANHGTIFLDEISEMHPTLQAKLLHVLQDREFSRLGGEEDVSVDVRVITSTNRQIEKELQNGTFREDLYYRINVVSIHLPPLRERKEDIPELSDYFLRKYSSIFDKIYQPLSKPTMNALLTYSWPGNVRELENLMKKIVVFENEESALQNLDLGSNISAPNMSASNTVDQGRVSLKKVGKLAAQEAEKQLILKTLLETRWNRKKAADLLEISYKALLYKIKQAGLSKKRITI
jgi:two-component system, NtrC family, response regulator AtoC